MYSSTAFPRINNNVFDIRKDKDTVFLWLLLVTTRWLYLDATLSSIYKKLE